MASANENTSKKSCLFCLSTDPKRFAVTSKTRVIDENGAAVKVKEEKIALDWSTLVSPSSASDITYLVEDQLKPIFILRELLNLPVQKCAEYLQLNDGVENPLRWFSVCTSCIKIVEEGYRVFCKIASLQKTLVEIKDNLKSLILVEQTNKIKHRRRKVKRNLAQSKVDIVCQDIREYIISESQPSDDFAAEKKIEALSGSRQEATAEVLPSSFGVAIANSDDNALTTPETKPNYEENEVIDFGPEDDAEWLPSYSDNDADYKELAATEKVGSHKKRKAHLKRNHSKRKKFIDEEPAFKTETDSLEEDKVTVEKIDTDSKIKSPIRKKLKLKYLQNCDLCVANYVCRESLRNHKKLHENNEGKACPDCGWLCKEDKLHLHVGMRHKPKQKSRRNFLRDRHKKQKQLKYDYKKITRVDMPYYCDFCHMMFTSKCIVINHINLYHPEAPSSSCPFCNSSKFETKQLLELHVIEEHPGETFEFAMLKSQDEPKICLHCSKSFPSKLTRDYHIAKFHKDKLLTCTICGHKAYKFCRYMEHKNIKHENEKFLCEKCPRSFTTDHYLKDHMKMEHGVGLGVGIYPNICTVCNVKFLRISALQKHMEHVHQKIKQQCCEHCGKAFSRVGDLTKHILLHTAPREKQYKQGPFFCKFCQAKFNVRQGLYYHLKKLHSDKYAFKCKNCGIGYISQNTLIKHQWKCKRTLSMEAPPLPTSATAKSTVTEEAFDDKALPLEFSV